MYSDSLIEMRVRIDFDEVEPVQDTLLESEDSTWTIQEDLIEFRVWMVGIFPNKEAAQQSWYEVEYLLPAVPIGAPVFRKLPERDWQNSHREHFHAWNFGRLHWVPVWERGTFNPPEGEVVLWIDPGMAFGTGNHETTRLCCERLVELGDPRGRSALDVGCGSGILALSAALLGFGRVEGFDRDPDAVRVSRENAALNGLDARVNFFEAELAAGLAGRSADVVLANIDIEMLSSRHAPRQILAAVAPGGTLILGGLPQRELENIRFDFGTLAIDWKTDSRERGEWCDLVMTRPGSPSAP